MTIAQYFHRVKSLCREISDLDLGAPIGDTRMKRIIIHGLRSEYRGFVAALQGWATPPSLVEFENLLARQEKKHSMLTRVEETSNNKTQSGQKEGRSQKRARQQESLKGTS